MASAARVMPLVSRGLFPLVRRDSEGGEDALQIADGKGAPPAAIGLR
jgi:hypothetical protein